MAAKIRTNAKNKRPKIQPNAGLSKAERHQHDRALPAEQVRERVEHAASGAAGAHADRRSKRCRTRSGQKNRAIREYA